MPDNEVLISELSTKAVNPLTMFELENTTDGEPDSGKTDASALGNFFLGQGTSPLEYADLQTTAKTPIGAINELDDDIADKAEIDDSTISADSAYSSQKIISLMPTNEASGAIASFKTQLAAPLLDVTLEINAQQASGTPTPDNPLPITGFTGANVADTSDSIEKSTYIKGIYEGVNGFIDLGSLAWTKASNNGRFYARFSASDNIKPAQSTAYKVNAIINNYTVESQNTVATLEPDMSFSVDGNNPPFIQIVNKAYTDATDFSNYISGKYLIYELATPEAPTITPVQFQTICTSFDINGALISVDWTTEAGTVYGGELDLLSGVLTVTHASITIDDLSISYWNSLFIAEISDKKIGLTNNICSIYKTSNGGGFAALNNLEIVGSPSTSYIYIRDDDYTNVTTFKQNRGTGVICYELLTPITYQLTQQQMSAFIGVNNIWHDANGDTAVKFKQDIQGYIDSKIAEVEAMVLSLP